MISYSDSLIEQYRPAKSEVPWSNLSWDDLVSNGMESNVRANGDGLADASAWKSKSKNPVNLILSERVNLSSPFAVGQSSDPTKWSPAAMFPTFQLVNYNIFDQHVSDRVFLYSSDDETKTKIISTSKSAVSNSSSKIATSLADEISDGLMQSLSSTSRSGLQTTTALNSNKNSIAAKALDNMFDFLLIQYVLDVVSSNLQTKTWEAVDVDVSQRKNDRYYGTKKVFAAVSSKISPVPSSDCIVEVESGMNALVSKLKTLVNYAKTLTGNDSSVAENSLFFSKIQGSSSSQFNTKLWEIAIDAILSSNGWQGFPAVIDEAAGEYSSLQNIHSLLDQVARSSYNFETTKLNFDCSRFFSKYGRSSSVGGTTLYRTDWLFDFEKYAEIVGKAVQELLSLSSWKDYNDAALTNFFVDNLIVVRPASTVTEEPEIQKLSPEDTFRDQADLTENDIRKIMRKKGNSIWYLDDYNWSVDMVNLSKLGNSIEDFQKLTIYEFQPDKQISYRRLVETGLQISKDLLTNLAGKKIGGEVIKKALETLGVVVTNEFTDDIADNADYASNIEWISNLLSGWWVGQYNVPYFGKDFLAADTTDTWSIGNLLSKEEYLVNDLTLNVQDIPTWKYNPGKGKQISTTLFLLNEDIESMIKNLQFLFTITAGSWWVQTSGWFYRMPNLYRVICPGRFVMLYASMASRVEFAGKIRKFSANDAQKIFGGTDEANYEAFKLFASKPEACNIPEAYKLTLTLNDITPQAFNVVANYFTDAESMLYPNIKVKQERGEAQQKTTDAIEGKMNSNIEAMNQAQAEAESA